MNMQSFVKYSQGKWLVQRTTYDLLSKKIWNLRFDLTVKQFLKQKKATEFYIQDDLNGGYTGLSLMWGQKASSYNVVIHPSDNELEIYTSKVEELNANSIYAQKIYYFNSSLLNIRFSNANFYVCEKLWFVSNNLALGISIVKCGDYCISVSFESKIRA